jgi:hypothetical protein
MLRTLVWEESSTMENPSSSFLTAFRGHFWGVRHWHQLDELWEQLIKTPQDAWYVYAVGDTPPITPIQSIQLAKVLNELNALLKRDHDEDYCGIVYVDSLKEPSFIKVFDPNNLGSVCGSSRNPPLPSWIISKIPPINLPEAMPQPTNRRHWWQKLFA